jgi:hypothetical protein
MKHRLIILHSKLSIAMMARKNLGSNRNFDAGCLACATGLGKRGPTRIGKLLNESCVSEGRKKNRGRRIVPVRPACS